MSRFVSRYGLCDADWPAAKVQRKESQHSCSARIASNVCPFPAARWFHRNGLARLVTSSSTGIQVLFNSWCRENRCSIRLAQLWRSRFCSETSRESFCMSGHCSSFLVPALNHALFGGCPGLAPGCPGSAPTGTSGSCPGGGAPCVSSWRLRTRPPPFRCG